MVRIKERALRNPLVYAVVLVAGIFAVLIVFTSVILFEPMEPTDNDEETVRLGFWMYGSNMGLVPVHIYHSDVEGYGNMHIPRGHWIFATDRFVTPEDRAVKDISDTMKDITEGMSDEDVLHIVNSFVAHTIRYESDDDIHGTDDYYQFPAETLYLGTGDCEDMAMLETSILKAMGYDAVPLISKKHCLVGVNIEGEGEYTEFLDTKYYHLESTTGDRLGVSEYGGDLMIPWYSMWSYILLIISVSMFVLLNAALADQLFQKKRGTE